MFGNGATNFSEEILTASAKALAIMVERFVPQNDSCFYSARDIGKSFRGYNLAIAHHYAPRSTR